MASLTTERCAHDYLSDRAGEPCVWCGEPQPAVAFKFRSDARAVEAALAESERRVDYLTARDSRDED